MILLLTGNGKGKTTSAIGCAIRALGNRMSVVWVSFMKSQPSGEYEMLRYFGDFSYEITGLPTFSLDFDKNINEVTRGLRFLDINKSEVAVLDEFIHLLNFGFMSQEFAEDLINHLVKTRTHIIITGSNAPQWLIDKADLVSEVKYIKHYFDDLKEPIRGLEF